MLDKEKVLQEVENEYAKGLDFLSMLDRHWGTSILANLSYDLSVILKGGYKLFRFFNGMINSIVLKGWYHMSLEGKANCKKMILWKVM